jgi:transposase
VGQHRRASASRLLGLDGFQVVPAELVGGKWQLAVQTTATVIGCVGCGERAELHSRRTVGVRDLPAGGRPVVLWWRKRLWRCREPACGVWTWTERAAAIRPRAVLTERARAEACRRVGKDGPRGRRGRPRPGVGWATIMRAVADHGTPLVDDPTRLDGVAALGLDETSFLKATRLAPTRWVTGLVDLEQGRLLEVVADRTRAAVGRWLGARPRGWLAQVGAVALDPGAALPARWSSHLATRPWSWTTSTPSGWPTWWSTRSAGGPSRPPSGTGTQTRSAVPHPQAAAEGRRAAHQPGTGAAAGWAGRR